MSACVDWLLREALRLISTDVAVEERKTPSTGENLTKNLATVDRESDDFRRGIGKMATMLNIPLHPDPSVQLAAVGDLLANRMSSPGRLQNREEKFACKLDEVTLGFDQQGTWTFLLVRSFVCSID